VKVIFLGTNGWYDTETGNTISILVKTEHFCLVLDAGNGFYKLGKYTGDNDVPVYIFLSHFHLDHVCGLHTIDMNKFHEGCTIIGGKGTAENLSVLMRQPFTKPLSEMGFGVNVEELDENGDDAFPFGIRILPLKHSSPCYGARITIDGKVISYIPDTGYCENTVELARGADLLIAECAYLPGESDLSWPHLNPESCALIAKESGAKKLALIHFEAKRYDTMQKREAAERTARDIFAESFASRDDMEIDV